ncbi:MAG: hypothetical protein VXZ73_01900 [Pseudomonadota bacterium]|nr:hypothetical protein [Pseudomonadota bacterium]
MKKVNVNWCYYILAGVLLSSHGYANRSGARLCQKRSGQTWCEDKEVSHINASGMIHFNNMNITGNCLIKGQVYAHKTKMGSLDLYGQAVLDDIQVSGLARLYGVADIRNSRFAKTLSVWSEQVDLDATCVRDIICHIQDGGGCCVRIKNGSQVQGDVVFKGAEGRVILQSGSVIKGVVLNGKVVQG